MTRLWGFLFCLGVTILICGLIMLPDVWTYLDLQRRLREKRRMREAERVR